MVKGRQVFLDSKHHKVAWLFPVRCPKAVGAVLLLPLARQERMSLVTPSSVGPVPPPCFLRPW